MVGNLECRHLAARLELFAKVFREALARPVLALLGDHIFEPGMAAVAAVAPIAVQPHHRRRRIEQIIGLDEGDRRREPGKGPRLVVRHAVAAAEKEIVAG